MDYGPEETVGADTNVAKNTKDTRAGGDASLGASVINLAKTCLGTGMLALPGALKSAGLLPGIAFLVITAVMGAFSLFLLGDVSSAAGRRPTLPAVGDAAMGSCGRILVNMSVLLNNVGSMINYLIVSSTSMGTVIGADAPSRPTLVIVLVLLISPLCLVKHVNMLRFSSAIGIAALIYVSGMVVLFALPWGSDSIFAPCGPPSANGTVNECRGTVELATTPFGITSSFVTFTYAYTCQHGMIPIVNELKEPTRGRKIALSVTGTVVIMIMLLLVAIPGYLTFGNKVKSNVLQSYPDDSVLSTVARVAISCDVLTSYPLLMYITRISVISLLEECCSCFSSTARMFKLDPASPETGPVSCCGRYFITTPRELFSTFLVLLPTVAVALVCSDLGEIVGLTGATGATMMGYISPGILFFYLTTHYAGAPLTTTLLQPEYFNNIANEAPIAASRTRTWFHKLATVKVQRSRPLRYLALGLFGLGIVIVPMGVVLTLVGASS